MAFQHFLCLLGLMLAFSLAVQCHPQKDAENLEMLIIIEKSMNVSASPCDNFYTYACGNWGQHYGTDDVMEMITMLNSRYEAALKEVIGTKHPQPRRHHQDFLDKALSYYHSCENRGDIDLTSYLNEIPTPSGAEWPLITELRRHTTSSSSSASVAGNSANFNVFEIMGYLYSLSLDSGMITVAGELKHGDLNMKLNIPKLPPLAEFQTYKILSALGFTAEVCETLTKELVAVDDYWQGKYKMFADLGDTTQMTYGEIQHVYPSIAKFLENFLPHGLKPDLLVEFGSLSYIEFLVGHQWQPKEIEKITNYLLIKFITHIGSTMGNDCITILRNRMPLAVAYMYHMDIYQPEAKEFNGKLKTLTQLIQRSYFKTLDRNRLNYSPAQRAQIRQKISKMVWNVGNIPENVTFSQVNQFYADIGDLDIQNFSKNDVVLLKHTVASITKCFDHMVCVEFESSPLNVITMNLVIVPFSSLQLPMYHHNLHPLLQLSLFGYILGHEFTHAIDPGTLALDTETFSPYFDDIATRSPHFSAALECMKSQSYTEFVDERVSDFVGAQVAYEAYEDNFNVQPHFTRIPWQQLFFLNLAQFFCGNNKAVMKDHDSDEVRLNQIAMNSEEFAQAFNCPRGTKMNPTRKCYFY